MNIAQALLYALKARGGREVFGIPGDFALPFFKIVEESGVLPLYCLSHEPAVGFAADAAARANCAIGVAAVTYGAGAFNLVNAVAAAYAERAPLAVISGTPGASEKSHGLLVHHQAKTLDSQFRVYREITADQARRNDPATAPQAIARVLKTSSERSLPVYLELPRDCANLACEPVPPDRPSPVDGAALAVCAEDVLAHLAAATSPVLMVGVEICRLHIAGIKRLAVIGRAGRVGSAAQSRDRPRQLQSHGLQDDRRSECGLCRSSNGESRSKRASTLTRNRQARR